MHLKELIQKSIKIIFGDTRQTIVSIVVAALVGGYTGLLYLSKTALEISLQLLNTQTPLWATISLVLLCCLYIYVKASKIPAKLNQGGQPFDVILEDVQVKVLSFLWKQPNKKPSDISESLKVDLEAIKFHLSELRKLGMVQTDTFGDWPTYQVWLLDQEGRRYLIKHKIS